MVISVVDTREAAAKVIHILKQYEFQDISSVELKQNHGHWLIKGMNPMTNTRQAFYLKFDNEPFHAAARILKEHGFDGEGDAFTLNVEFAKTAKVMANTILFAQPDHIYQIDSYQFYNSGVDYPQQYSNETVKCIPVEACDEWALSIPIDTKSLQVMTAKERKLAKERMEYEKQILEWKDMPMLQCPHCHFKNVYQISIDHHMRYTHMREHPPNEWTPSMTEKDYMDWEDALSGRKGRRSSELNI